MSKNPTLQELGNTETFEKIAELSHHNVKEFVFEQIRDDKFLIPVYMVYQVIMILTGVFFFIRSIVFFFRGVFGQFIWTLISAIFSFTILVIIHELLHGLALWLTGARKINFGANFKKFMFFAEADQHILNRYQFLFVAMTPLFVIKLVSIVGILIFYWAPAAYFFLIVMCLHSLFCAGDVGLVSFFRKYRHQKVFTYDSRKEKKTYFFRTTGKGVPV